MQNSLPKRIHDDRNGLDYILQGDYVNGKLYLIHYG